MNGNDLIAHILQREGVEWLACFPNNPLIEAAARIGIRPIAFRHERGAVMAADGFSRVSDRQRFGVVAVQSQAGAENALGGIAQAYADNIPILVLPGGPTTSQMPVRPNYSAVRNYQGVVKSAEAVLRPDDIPAVMRRAFSALRNGAPGPVVVELTADVCAREVADDALVRYTPPPRARQAPDPASVVAAVDAVLAAERPVLWAGGGVLFGAAGGELQELAELAALPVFCTMQGKSALDESHPLALGAGGMTTTGPAASWLDGADVLLAVGTSLTRTPYGQRVPRAARLIHNTDNPDEIGKDENVEIALPGDVTLTLRALIDEVERRLGAGDRAATVRENARATVEAEIAAARTAWYDTWAPALTDEAEPLGYYRVIQALNDALDRDRTILTHDAGAPRDCLVPFYAATTPHSYVGWGKTTHLGFGIPLAIGAKLAHPDRFCCNVMGDGAFGMSGTDIETAARSGVAITTVVLNNGAMATYPIGTPMDPVTARTEYGVTHMQGDYAKIAEGMGAVGITVRTADELVAALEDAQERNARGVTVLIDVHANVEARRSPNAPLSPNPLSPNPLSPTPPEPKPPEPKPPEPKPPEPKPPEPKPPEPKPPEPKPPEPKPPEPKPPEPKPPEPKPPEPKPPEPKPPEPKPPEPKPPEPKPPEPKPPEHGSPIATHQRGAASMPKVAVTSGLFAAMPDMAAKLRETYPDAKIVQGRPPVAPADIIEFVKGHDVVVAGIEPYTEEVLDGLPELRVIACCSAGVDHLDPQLLKDRGIAMGWIPGVNKYAVSEMALCFMIDILREFHTNTARLMAGRWSRARGKLLRHRTVGIHGCGNIGKEVVKLLQPFECRILACDRVDYPEFYAEYGVEAVGPEQLWAESEILTVHLPRNSSTLGLYTADVLDRLRPGAYVVNTARGRIFDEAALRERLEDSRLAAAAFDVFAVEPPDSFDLMQLPNFLATAHIGAGAEEAWRAMAEAGMRGIAENAIPEPGLYPFD